MGKIGDLWVKLGLKKEEFDKGMNNAEKKSEGFGDKMGKLKGKAVAVWAAIGTAVLKVGKDIATATNDMEDKWEMFTNKASIAWKTFIRTLVSGDWANFVSNFKKEVAAIEQLTEIQQADTEIMNSIAIQRARMADQLAELEITMRDQTKSYKERAEAAKKYLAMVEPIYAKEIERAEALKDAQYEAFLGPVWGKGAGYNRANQRIWDQFLIDYGSLDLIPGTNKTMADIISTMTGQADAVKSEAELDERLADLNALLEWGVGRYGLENNTKLNVWEWFRVFFRQYELNRDSKEVQALVDSVIGLEKARSAYNQETKKIQTLLGNLGKGGRGGGGDEEIPINWWEDWRWLYALEDEPTEVPDIDVTPIEEAEEAIDGFLAKWREEQAEIAELNKMIEDSIVSSMSNGLQAITDMMMGLEGASPAQVLGALLEPFAQTAISLGEMLVAQGLGIEAFKKSLESLQGGAAIAAGVGLIALGSAMRSGIQALANRGAGSSTSTGSYTGGSSAADVQNYTSELTIYVEGRISGSDIVLAGNKTLNKWRR